MFGKWSLAHGVDYRRDLYDFLRPCARGRWLVHGHVRLYDSGGSLGSGRHSCVGVHSTILAIPGKAASPVGFIARLVLTARTFSPAQPDPQRRVPAGLCSFQLGRASAPTMPHPVHT